MRFFFEMSVLRHQVLREYKKVFRAAMLATPGDLKSTKILHEQARIEFKKNMDETDTEQIIKYVQAAKELVRFRVYSSKISKNFQKKS